MMVVSLAAHGMGRLARPLAVAATLLVTAAQAAPAGHDDPQVLRIEDASGQPTTTYGLERLKRDFPQHDMDTRTPWTAVGETIRYRGP